MGVSVPVNHRNGEKPDDMAYKFLQLVEHVNHEWQIGKPKCDGDARRGGNVKQGGIDKPPRGAG